MPTPRLTRSLCIGLALTLSAAAPCPVRAQPATSITITPFKPDAPAPIDLAQVLIARLPATVRGCVVTRDLSALIDELSSAPPAALQLPMMVLADTLAPAQQLAQSLGYTPEQASRRLLGGVCVLVGIDAGPGESKPHWGLIASVSAATESRLREKLEALPGEVALGTPVLSVERGRYAMVTRALPTELVAPVVGDAEPRTHLVLITPRGEQGALDQLLGVVAGTPGPSTLGTTPAPAMLSELPPGVIGVLVRGESTPLPPWSVCTAVSITHARRDDGGQEWGMRWLWRDPGRVPAIAQVSISGPHSWSQDPTRVLDLEEWRIDAPGVPWYLRLSDVLDPPSARGRGHRHIRAWACDGVLSVHADIRFEHADDLDVHVQRLLSTLEARPCVTIDLGELAEGVVRQSTLETRPGTPAGMVLSGTRSVQWSGNDSSLTIALGEIDNRMLVDEDPWMGMQTGIHVVEIAQGSLSPARLLPVMPTEVRQRLALIGLTGFVERISSVRWEVFSLPKRLIDTLEGSLTIEVLPEPAKR